MVVIQWNRVGFRRLVRFYQAAVVNTAFGFGLYAIFIAAGLNPFVAQAISFVCGVAFNYVTYSRHAFRDATGRPGHFVAVYAVNYVVNVAMLFMFNKLTDNHYVSGALAALGASLINFLLLRKLVFRVTAA